MTWNMIVSRFVAYCSEQYLVEDLDLNDDFGMETCVLCFNIFRDHLMKCRSHLLDKDRSRTSERSRRAKGPMSSPFLVERRTWIPDGAERPLGSS